MVVDQPAGDGNLMSSSSDVSAVLRKVHAILTKQDFKVPMFGSIA
jgi:galactokinase/mevalonate kinase-like predicted kinase